MKKVFHASPLMIFSIIKPFLFVLVIPVLKGVIQYAVSKKITGVLSFEIVLAAVMLIIASLRRYSFRLELSDGILSLDIGFIFRKHSVININNISSVETERNPLSALFGAVIFRLNTEAGKKGKPDFKFVLNLKDSCRISAELFGEEPVSEVKFSSFKVAVMAAGTSSAVTGMIVAVPVINRAGKLLGLALERMLLNEINTVSSHIKTVFPPVVNTVSLLLLTAYAISFFYSFFKYIRFRILTNCKSIQVKTGFFVRHHRSFKREAVNNCVIEQTPLMMLFRRYVMKVNVGGFGDLRSLPVLIPSGSKPEIEKQFNNYFPMLTVDGERVIPEKNGATLKRFLFLPKLFFSLLAAVSVTLCLIFSEFFGFILFLSLVGLAFLLLYTYLCVYESRNAYLNMGKTVSAGSVKGFKTNRLFCSREKIGEIKLTRFPIDFKKDTCNVTVYVCSESADYITVRHLKSGSVKAEIEKCYGIKV